MRKKPMCSCSNTCYQTHCFYILEGNNLSWWSHGAESPSFFSVGLVHENLVLGNRSHIFIILAVGGAMETVVVLMETFMSSLLGSTHVCEQMFSRMKCRGSRITSKISNEYLEILLRTADTATEPAWYVSFTETGSNRSSHCVLWNRTLFCVFFAPFFCFNKKYYSLK